MVNRIHRVQRSAFKSLGSLRVLNLGTNHLADIYGYMWEGLNSHKSQAERERDPGSSAWFPLQPAPHPASLPLPQQPDHPLPGHVRSQSLSGF